MVGGRFTSVVLKNDADSQGGELPLERHRVADTTEGQDPAPFQGFRGPRLAGETFPRHRSRPASYCYPDLVARSLGREGNLRRVVVDQSAREIAAGDSHDLVPRGSASVR